MVIMDALDKMRQKIEKLGEEATQIVNDRDKLFAKIDNLNVRLTQITGAISELDKLIKECESDDGKENKTEN